VSRSSRQRIGELLVYAALGSVFALILVAALLLITQTIRP
jgi:hypothetical protein